MNKYQKELEKTFTIVSNYLDGLHQTESNVIKYRPPKELSTIVDLAIPQNGVSFEKILNSAEQYLTYATKTSHKNFSNQLFGGFNFPAFLGDLLTSLTNTSMYTYEVAPLATLMEIEIVKKMCSFVGFPNGSGQFVTGGSNANLLALLCARNKVIPGAKESGYRANTPLVIFTSDQAHYSFFKAANLLGIGTDYVVKVKTDHRGSMIPNELEREIQIQKQKGNLPFFVAATAGTTVLGAFDPIEEIAGMAENYGLWFHIDGAYGGSALLSKKHKFLLKGCEKADSFTWDPHKMMTIPLICSVILIKDKSLLLETCSSEGTGYLFHEHENKDFDLGPMSLQCGRRVDSLKLWFSWKYYGDCGYEKRINKLFELANYASKFIENHKNLELVRPRQSVNVCFRYIPEVQADLNQFNLCLRDQLAKGGKCLLNYSRIDGKVILRLVFVNPEVTESDLDKIFELILDQGRA